jgi:hypothetical protein
MLIKKTEQNGDIVTFRISVGDEIIGEVVHTDDTTVTIKQPLVLANGPQGVSLAPATLLGDSESDVIFMKSHIMCWMKTRDGAEKAYRESTSGIALATTTNR